MADKTIEELQEANQKYFEKAENSFRTLFDAARQKNELHFAMSLNPEFRGEQGPGWSTADDAHRAFDEYMQFLHEGPFTSLKARIALAFYCHLSEASGFYEIPKNMLRVAEGEKYNLWPFRHLVKKHEETGNIIAPNANKVLKDLSGHAETLGFHKLAEVVRDAFDSDIRNGYAHADYIIWPDGLRLRKRNGGYPRVVSWSEFQTIFDRGINFFHILRQVVDEYVKSYNPPKQIQAQLDNEPIRMWTIHYNEKEGTFSISG